jgi:hypothetical protein
LREMPLTYEAHHENEIEKLFGIQPSALTAEEANYLIGFKSTDGLRNRSATSEQERRRRLLSKGISEGA